MSFASIAATCRRRRAARCNARPVVPSWNAERFTERAFTRSPARSRSWRIVRERRAQEAPEQNAPDEEMRKHEIEKDSNAAQESSRRDGRALDHCAAGDGRSCQTCAEHKLS